MDPHPDRRADRIHALLAEAFAPARVVVDDQSALHAGHAGARPGGETHYAVTVVTPRFAGMNRVTRHRAVTEQLAGEFDSGLHALSLTLRTPDEERG